MWAKRLEQGRLFGARSERFVAESNPQQLHLGEALPVPEMIADERRQVPAHTRRAAKTDLAQDAQSIAFFDETKALVYGRERRAGLEIFLTDPDVPIDTNHLERALCAVPMGRKAWLFCWTEVGAQHVGVTQSLIVTCRLHGIDPYAYLVDVLQRVGEHPAARVAQLTPRLWKQHFAANPMRSDLHKLRGWARTPAGYRSRAASRCALGADQSAADVLGNLATHFLAVR